jgi:glycosyltransferase involved in cell wall biosynthesis
VSLSVVIPILNEAESLPHLHKNLHAALDALDLSWEVIFVDDGSTDGTPELLTELARRDPAHVRVIVFRRNHGQTAAMAAGVDHAAGEIIAFMDGDLQNDPADIPMMLATMRDDDVDVVCGWRVHRQDAMATRRLPSQIANCLIARATRVPLHDYGCSLKLFRREIIRGFRLYGEMHRFIPVYAHAVGGSIAEVPVRHHARRFGKTKYGLSRTLKVILDLYTVRLLTDFATKPMYLLGKPGLKLMGLGALVLPLAALAQWMAPHAGTAWPTAIIGVLLLLAGFHGIQLGLIGELLMRTYHESQHKRPYTVRALHGRGLAEDTTVAAAR